MFEEIPKLDNIFAPLDIKKMEGYQDYYRISVGNYRIRVFKNVVAQFIGQRSLMNQATTNFWGEE